jgi:di/tricarboxylate transporter
MITIDAIFVKALFISSFLTSALLVVFSVISLQEARGAINWSVYMTVASGIGIGKAMLNSGISGSVANFVLYMEDLIGIEYVGMFGCIYLITVLVSYLVSSNVAVGLIYPIAAQVAKKSGVDAVLLEYSVMFACASCYMMPFDYTESSMVFGLGGKFF